MGGAVGVEPAQVEQRGVEVAAVERAEQVVPAWNQMGDVVDQPPVFERHQDRIAKRPAFDADAKPREVADAGHALAARDRFGAKHDGQRRIEIGLAWREHAERNAAAPAIGDWWRRRNRAALPS